MTVTFWVEMAYLAAISLFILGLKRLSSVRTALRGNRLAAMGMLIAVVAVLFESGIVNWQTMVIGVLTGSAIGVFVSIWVKMTAMPQMVAIFNGFGGLASALVACFEYLRAGPAIQPFMLTTIILGTLVGAVTFAGSVVAFAKLQGLIKSAPVVYPFQNALNLILALGVLVLGGLLLANPGAAGWYWGILLASSLLGILLVLPIGGADMPVVISLLNSYSGIAAALTGFVLMNEILIVAGSLVGSAGLILTQIMCRAMNRSLANVAFGAFGRADEAAKGTEKSGYISVKSCTAEEAAMILESARLVIIVPGYGMAVSRAQHAIRDLAKLLESRGAQVKYAIHPVAGRMPGHMNVLLAEADVPYDQLYEMDQINPEFDQADVALVLGANDVVNPSARHQKNSPIYGMPILDVDKARSVIVIKRSLSPGFAGIKNPLFENEKTLLFFADARKAVEEMIKELKNL